ncbi:DUF6443 domain-containing protein [Mucilaginibacter sp. cycad4]|uniref:DUF6443 domain-containing protein n=1 Tax=Mucilaginibacter sp. cycad4 TaxID=3342096 RepID=UPI002AAB0D44|nr:DUF6443 domain-containing protein [Mucilaginibacter gossypii]WPV01586.1 DUF6443 domain-containing protein [Mucilaginibacter gossypii]
MKIKQNFNEQRVNYSIRTPNFYILIIVLVALTGLNASGQITLNAPNTKGTYKDPYSITLGPNFTADGANGAFVAMIEPGYLTPGSPANFISTWTPKMAIATAATLKAQENNSSNLNISTTFSDNLGRVIQTVSRAQSVNKTDMIQPYEYDNLGRQVNQYLPYSYSGNGAYRVNAVAEQAGFYQSGSTINPQSNSPASKAAFDNSLLNRPVEQGAVGDSWQLTGSSAPNSGHTIKFDYTGNNEIAITDVENTRIVVAYGVNINASGDRSLYVYGSTGYYAANDLHVKVIKDPNWTATDGRNGTHEIYTDEGGKDVLKRSFIKNPSGTLEIVSTYFVYDDLGNLCYILPQASNPDQLSSSNSVNISPSALNSVCYQYRYDERQRLIATLLPGKDWEYTVYNLLDQPVASQDGNQRLNKEWSVKKYDALGRTIISGTWNNDNRAITRDDLQASLNRETAFYENRISTGNGYSADAWPQNLSVFYTVDYFDDYNVPGAPSGFAYQPYSGNPSGYSNQVQGFPTISKTGLVSNLNAGLWTFNYYDSQGKLIQVQSANHLSGKDIYNNEYDFNGNVTKTIHQHSSSAGSLNITNKFTYDHQGRELQHFEQIANDPEVLMTQLTYNDLGQVIDRKLHQKSGNSKFIQSIDYRYNIHGALTSINDPSLTNNSTSNPDDVNSNDPDKFGMILKYEGADQAQYGTNIGSMQWAVGKPIGSSLTSPVLKYDYTYDKADRMVAAASSTGATKDGNFSENVFYDKMGNIKNLVRWAKLSAGKTQIDNLKYTYLNGNQVDEIDDDSGNNVYGFKDNGGGNSSKQAGEYAYDLAGNLSKDLNKGITSIIYNNFNLPASISWADGRAMTYDYDGTGEKLRRTYKVGTNVYVTDYIGEIQYEQGQIALLTTNEGIASKINGNPNYIYQYFLKDQVGNTRVVIQPVYPGETTADVIQVTNFYPYGMDYRSDDLNSLFSYTSGIQNKYLFNGKELQNGVETYDFGARNYDASTGRWNAPDPANQFTNESPYAALGNNPVLNTDPDGKILPVIAAVGIAALIGGTTNLVMNAIQGNVHSWSAGFSYFGVGAAAGASSLWNPLAGAGIMGAGNNLVTQVQENGWGNINGGQIAVSGATGVVTAWAGGQLSSAISPYISGYTSQIASPLIKGALVQGGSNAASGFVLGAGFTLLSGKGVDDAFSSGLSGAVNGFGTGVVSGSIGGYQYAKANNLGLWNGRSTLPPLEAARSAGISGENAVGITAPKIRIESITKTANYRIPEALTTATIEEVKNVKRLGLTNQIKDFHLYSQREGLKFIIYVRPTTVYQVGTTFTKPLQTLINKGTITIKPIPTK